MTSLKARFGLVVLLSAGGYAVSFGSQLVIAYHFGTSPDLDVYWGGLALVGLLCFYMAPLKEALVPAVHRARERGDAEAGKVLSAGLSLLFVLMSGSSMLLFLPSTGLAGIVSGVGDGAAGDILQAVPWLAAYLWTLVLAETLNTTLVSFNQVVRQALVRIAAALVLLATIAIAGASMGVGGLFLAQVLSMLTLVLASAWALRYLRFRLLIRAWPVLRDSGMLPLFTSLLITYLFSQLYVLAERSAMIHLGTGLVSGFQYSTALVNVLVSLLAYPLANLLWSRFLAQVAGGEERAAQTLALRACGLLFYLLMVVCVFVWANAREIVLILYGRGAFDEASVQLTSAALRATIFAAIPISIMAVLGRWLMSLPGAHRQVWIGLATTGAGLSVIGGAVWVHSAQWVMLHWLLANFAGLVVSASIFVHAAGFKWRHWLLAFRWLLSTGLVAFAAAWLTPSMALGDTKIALAAAVAIEGVMYLLIVLALTWTMRMGGSLQTMIRGQ